MDCNLAELPEGWAWTTYEQIGKWSGGGTPSKQIASYWIGGEIPWISPKDMKSLLIYDSEDRITDDAIKSSSAKLIPSDSLLFVVRSGILRRTLPVALTRIDAAVNQDLKALTPSDHIFADYLLYHALAFNDEIRRSCSKDGTTVESIEFLALKEYPIPLPPLSEQHRIVARIEELFSRLDAGVESLLRAKAQLQRYRQSVLQAAVTGRLTAEWRAAHPEVEAANSDINEIDIQGTVDLPDTWTWTNLRALKDFSLYGPRFSSDDYSTRGYSVLRTSDISDSGKVNIKTAPLLPLTREEFSRFKVERGDILITRTGSLGTLAVFNDDVEAIPGAYLIQYRLKANIETSWYIFYYLKSPYGQKKLHVGGAGVGRPNLNAPTIEAIPIPLPPLDEQQKIIMEIEWLFSISDNMQLKIDNELRRSVRLRQSILQRAFQGRLVPQDPRDEPAGLLLERIRAERIKEPQRRGRKSKAQQARLSQ